MNYNPKLTTTKQLVNKSLELRISLLEMLARANSGHAGGAMGIADVITYLYYNYLNHDPKHPNWDERDYFLISNGHVGAIWYAALADTGYFPKSDLKGFRQIDSHLEGHPKNTSTPGVFNSSGPLGHGIGQATGVALGLKIDDKPNRVVCLTSDGEQQEGAVWENIHLAAKYKLDNLCLILDINKIQIDGFTDEIMAQPGLLDTYRDAGWQVLKLDGHDFDQISKSFAEFDKTTDKPTLLAVTTTPGKGVSFIENRYEYHDWRGSAEDAEKGVEELKGQLS